MPKPVGHGCPNKSPTSLDPLSPPLLDRFKPRLCLSASSYSRSVSPLGVGTRNYYRKMGYELEGPYMVKHLNWWWFEETQDTFQRLFLAIDTQNQKEERSTQHILRTSSKNVGSCCCTVVIDICVGGVLRIEKVNLLHKSFLVGNSSTKPLRFYAIICIHFRGWLVLCNRRMSS